MKLSNKMCFQEDFAKVSQFYNCFPYPIDVVQDGPPPGFNWRWSVEESLAFCTGALPGQLSPQKEWKILDAGCGTGLLLDYIDIPPENYVGWDISEEMVSIAQCKHPHHKFVCRDITASSEEKYDVVVSLFGVVSIMKNIKGSMTHYSCKLIFFILLNYIC